MKTKFQWTSPTIPVAEHAAIEALVTSALRNIDYFASERRIVVVRFIPESPFSDVLVATVEIERSGKLLAAIEARRKDPKIKVIPLELGQPS